MDNDIIERLAIRDLIENWAVWRDAGDWERFATVWHADGVMNATWFQGPAADFIRVTREGWAKGVSILHFLGGSAIDLAGDRAIAQTKMTISQRASVHGIACDVVCLTSADLVFRASELAALFPPDHPYHWTTIGEIADLNAARVDDVREGVAGIRHAVTEEG